MKKLALIISGGSMACAYSAGFLKALEEVHGITQPDIAIAGSAGAGSLAYYVAGQNEASVHVWADLLSTRRYINLLRFWKIIDVDYLIDEVFKKQAPMNTDVISGSKIQYLIPATECKTGKLKYFSTKSNDILEALRATKAIPILYNKRVLIGGTYYFDTRLSAAVEPHIKKACEENATHLIVVATNFPGKLWLLGFKLWLSTRSELFNTNYKAGESQAKEYVVNPKVRKIYISPQIRLDSGAVGSNKKTLRRLISAGYDECKENIALKDFLKEMQAD